ncbi:hypothetical protein HDK90DRAFT_59675 [Phyllosticta capitalensis]|uniref:Uncharacterized protein n=1 Tax=Phyllosticta capitalensis TaxID=121624 RepID=A0ABR1YEP3_9PEZI
MAMSSSIAIPKPKKNKQTATSSSSYSPASSAGASYQYGVSAGTSSASSPSSSTPSQHPHSYFTRRPSMLSSSISKSEHIVVNVGHPDAPRLITCVKASQGFDWNQDIFLPSYADYDTSDIDRRPDPVDEITLTDEEIADMFPQNQHQS